MKAPLILACLFLLSPMLPAGYRLLDDGPPGFLHFQDVEDDPDEAGDTYLRINAITAVIVMTDKEREKAPYLVQIRSNSMRSGGEPLVIQLDFTKKEDAENMMRKITRLVNEAK